MVHYLSRAGCSRSAATIFLVAGVVVVLALYTPAQSFPSSTSSFQHGRGQRQNNLRESTKATPLSRHTSLARPGDTSNPNHNRSVSSAKTLTAGFSSQDNNNNDDDDEDTNDMNATTTSRHLTPRAQSCLLMSLAMALHFGGYEFARSGAMALFTSTRSHGFGSIAAAYPFAMGLVTPVSLSLLYGYGRVLKAKGPRRALYVSAAASVGVLITCSVLLYGLMMMTTTTTTTTTASRPLSWLQKTVMAVLFVFQNSYAHLVYTQQWSFLGSVMTPTEGTKWFSLIAGLSSVVCTLTAKLVPSLLTWFGDEHGGSVGLLGLIGGTCVTLIMSLLLADGAHRLSENHGFNPTSAEKNKKEDNDNKESESLLAKTGRMFKTSNTLAGLFCEVISFQSLSTVLNVCFVQQLQQSIPVDINRAAFTSHFYALVNGSSGLMQFLVLPLARKFLEPKWVYRFLPLLLMPLLTISATTLTIWVKSTSEASLSIPFLPTMDTGLFMAALAFFALKSTDYSIRNVANEMVYQPLDFDARYLGKEVNGVFANRVGKSASSMVLSWITMLFPGTWGRAAGGAASRHLSQLAVGVGTVWSMSSVWLSQHIVSNKKAEEKVQERNKKMKDAGQRVGAPANEATSKKTT